MAYGLPELKTPDLVGQYAQGLQFKEAKEERERKRPIVEQLEQLNIQKGEQALNLGKRNLSLKDMAIDAAKEKKESEDMADFGRAASWADTPEKWEQALDFYEKQGKDVTQFRGNFELAPMVRAMSNPDYAKQQLAQQNLMQVIKGMPQDKQAQALAIGTAAPGAFYKSAAEGLYAQDGAQLESLIAPLPQIQKDKVSAVYAADPDEGVKLASSLIKQSEKPMSATEKKEKIKVDAAFEDLKIVNNKFESMLKDPVFSESVGPIDQFTASIGAAFGSDAGIMKKKAERAVRGLVRGLVASFPGSLSEKELSALEAEMPNPGDPIEIWSDWFENDFTPTYKLAKRKAGIAPEGGSDIDSLVNKYAD